MNSVEAQAASLDAGGFQQVLDESVRQAGALEDELGQVSLRVSARALEQPVIAPMPIGATPPVAPPAGTGPGTPPVLVTP